MAGNDAQDQKDYQDYLAYQQYVASHGAQTPPQQPQSYVRPPQDTGYTPGGQPASVAAADPEGNARNAKLGIGLALGPIAGAEAEGLGAFGRGAVNSGAAGLQKLFSNLIDKKSEATEGVAGNAALGGALSLGASAVGAGANKLADYLAQRSVGMRKYMPGVGNSLVDQGIVGTKNQMTNQVGDKLANEESNLQGLVSKLGGSSDSQEIADAISARGDKFVSPSGITISPVQSDLDKVRSAASEFASQGEGGELTPQDLLSLKRQGDWAGYTASGNPASATDAEIGRTIADKSRSMLSGMSDGATAESLARERALILAKKALEKPEAIHQGPGAMAMFGKVPGTSLFESLAAQAAQKGVGTPASAATDPRILQSLFGAKNATGGQ